MTRSNVLLVAAMFVCVGSVYVVRWLYVQEMEATTARMDAKVEKLERDKDFLVWSYGRLKAEYKATCVELLQAERDLEDRTQDVIDLETAQQKLSAQTGPPAR